MGITKKLIGVSVFVVLFILLMLGATSAHEFRTGNNVTTGQNEIIDQTLFVAGQTLDIDSEVFGDVFCAGQTINITGDIHGDVICAGQTLRISGKVDGDVRLAGQSVTIGGEVTGNATVASQSFNLQTDGVVGGDVSTGAEDVSINGVVGRDIAVGSSRVVISGEIGRNIKGNTERLVLTSNAVVNGNIEYESINSIDQSSEATVAGTVSRTIPESNNATGATIFGLAIAWFIYIFLAMLFTSLVIALVIPGVLQSTTDRLMKSPWKALLIGFIASLVAPFLLIIIGITIIGLPLMILFGLIWLVVAMLSGPFTAFYLGRLIVTKSGALLTMLVGSTVLLAIYFIPFIGFFAMVGAYWLGVGMILQELFRRNNTVEPTLEPSEILAIPEAKPSKTKTAKKSSAKPKAKK